MMSDRCPAAGSENRTGSATTRHDTGLGNRGEAHACRVFAALLFAGNLFLHKPLSDVCDALYDRLGFAVYNRAALLVVVAVSVVGVVILATRSYRALFQPRVALLLLALAALTVMAQRWLLVANIELIHFPQYGLLAGFLIGAGLPPIRAWLGSTLAGGVDELYQYTVIYAGRPDTYLDFNDMVLNALGAAWMVSLCPSGRAAAGSALAGGPQRRLAALALALGGVVVVGWIDPPRLAPLFRIAATGLPYHRMSASEAFSTTVLLWVALRWARRDQWVTKLSRTSPGALQTHSGRGDFKPS